MPFATDIYGQTCNLEKVYGVELRIRNSSFTSSWWMWRKYSTMRAMLQGLKDFKKHTPESISTISLPDGRKKAERDIWEYRPVHVHYKIAISA